MKLLFDENLAPRLPGILAGLYPGSLHVRDAGLLGATDEDVWSFALRNGFAIVSKDSDFQQRAVLLGPPPKVIWIRLGGRTTDDVATILRESVAEISAFADDAETAVLILD